jgi:enoyl-CoA hydratase/carnithine racemase
MARSHSGGVLNRSMRTKVAMPPYQHVLTEQRGRVCIITMNRPDALNAYNRAYSAELQHAIRAADDDPETGCIVFTGAGKAFAAGADIMGGTDPHAQAGDRSGEWFCARRRMRVGDDVRHDLCC